MWKESEVLCKGNVRNIRAHTGPSQWYLCEFLVMSSVLEKQVSCQHRRSPGGNRLLHVDTVAVVPVVTPLIRPSNAFRDKILTASVSGLAAPLLWHPWVSSPSMDDCRYLRVRGVLQSAPVSSILEIRKLGPRGEMIPHRCFIDRAEAGTDATGSHSLLLTPDFRIVGEAWILSPADALPFASRLLQ